MSTYGTVESILIVSGLKESSSSKGNLIIRNSFIYISHISLLIVKGWKDYDSSPFPQALENIINVTWETAIMHRINWQKEISLKCKNPSLTSNKGGNSNKERKSK